MTMSQGSGEKDRLPPLYDHLVRSEKEDLQRRALQQQQLLEDTNSYTTDPVIANSRVTAPLFTDTKNANIAFISNSAQNNRNTLSNEVDDIPEYSENAGHPEGEDSETSGEATSDSHEERTQEINNAEAKPASSSHVVLPNNLEIRGEEQCARSVRLFNNPLAADENWSVRSEDWALLRLPKLDFSMRFKQRFKNESGKNDDSTYPSFSRDPTSNPRFQRSNFGRITIPSKTQAKFASDGFKSYYDGQVMAAHDVSPADWYRFLEDIKDTGKTNVLAGNLILQGIPMIHQSGLNFPLIRLIESSMKRNKQPGVNYVIDTWNQKFFNQRGIEINLLELGETRRQKKRHVKAGDAYKLVITPFNDQ